MQQLETAAEIGLPLIFHERDSGGRFLELLRTCPPPAGAAVIHCFVETGLADELSGSGCPRHHRHRDAQGARAVLAPAHPPDPRRTAGGGDRRPLPDPGAGPPAISPQRTRFRALGPAEARRGARRGPGGAGPQGVREYLPTLPDRGPCLRPPLPAIMATPWSIYPHVQENDS